MRAFCTISLLAVSLLPLCLGYRLPSAPLFLRRNAIGSATHLKALPTVGEVVVAEVDDIGGSFDNPTVTFSVGAIVVSLVDL